MFNTGWIKYFTDGSIAEGLDDQVDAKEASWSKGQLENIRSINVIGNRYNFILEIENTEWHQFDRFITVVGSDSSIRQLRVIQAKIQEHHLEKYLLFRTHSNLSNRGMIMINPTKDIQDSSSFKTINAYLLDNRFLNKWITVVGNDAAQQYGLMITEKKGQL